MISVIIPMYNAQATIQECLQSLIKQTYKDIEIIVVNDGSADDSLKIVEKMACSDSRIRCISQPNGGVSQARNHGIRVSKGDFLCFVDSDDTVTEDYLSCLLNSMLDTESDVSICGYQMVTNSIVQNKILDSACFESLSGKITEDLFVLRNFINSPCMKLYRADIVRKHCISFPPEMVMAEDQCFNYRYYAVCSSVSFVNKPNYIYYRKDSGLDSKRTMKCYQNDLDNIRDKSNFVQERKIKNGEYIVAEDICCTARKYVFVSDGSNSIWQSSKRLRKLSCFCPKVHLEANKDNLLFRLIRYRLGIVYVLYQRLHRSEQL